jgi:hypothetical protein
MRYLVLALLILGCRTVDPRLAPETFPALPDTAYTQSGATAVFIVDSIPSNDSTRTVVGQYWFARGHVYISRLVTSEKQRRKVYEHERCHIVLHESGLAIHMQAALQELLCDAFANARVAEIERLSNPGR